MSTDYIFLKEPKIKFEVFKRKLKSENAMSKYGIKYARRAKDRKDDSFAIVDSAGNYLWVYEGEGGTFSFSRYGANDVYWILELIEKMTDQRLISEHDDEYFEIMTADEEIE